MSCARLVVAKVEGGRDRLVGDLEVAAAGEFLELHQREVGLDAGGVAVHQQTDGAGGRQQRGLSVAIAVLLAKFERAIPAVRAACSISSGQDSASRPIGVTDSSSYSPVVSVVGGAAVVANDPQHVRRLFTGSPGRAELAAISAEVAYDSPVMIAVMALVKARASSES